VPKLCHGTLPSLYIRADTVIAITAMPIRGAAMSPPDLQSLVLAHGGYDRIPPDAWARFDADMARWKECLRLGLGYYESDRAVRRR
jgi:hypothetical protein